MQKPFFRICSLLLTVILLVNMLPMSIFAEEFQEAQAAAAAEEATKVTDAKIVAEVEEKRTEYSKQFKLDNGLFVAAVYAEPVHYLEDGQWVEIDNTLKAASDGTYSNTAGVWDVSLPSELTGKTPITITKDGYTLSFQMAGELNSTGQLQTADLSLESAGNTFSVSGTKTTKGEIKTIDFASAKESAEHEEFVLEKNTSQILYDDVYENTDVQYDLQGNRVKESIIIDSYSSDLRGYRYILKTDQMVPVLNEDGSIHLYDKEENIVMTMPAPYLIDAKEQFSYDIQVNLDGNEGVYTLSYLLPTQWLAAEDRAWPVILDPVVDADVSRTNIQDLTVAQCPSEQPNNNILECGYGTVNHQQRIYIQYVDIPELTSSDVVVEAHVQLIKAQTSNLSAPVVEVHKVLNEWDQSTITWENQPAIDPLVEDFKVTKYSGYYKWEITDLVRDWYTSGNTGMVLQMSTDGAENPTADWQQFYSSEYAWDVNRPYLQITFRNNNGIENYWDYSTASAGRAGTGYVNTYTGNLTWIRSDLGFGGNIMPVSISHTYNLNDSGENPYGMGYGWRTNFNQRVYYWEEDDSYYVWEDGDGTSHYFKYGSYATYYDEDNLGLTLKTNGPDGKEYSIADRKGNITYFDTKGRMICQENNQKTKSSITIVYTDAESNHIDYITDGVGRKYDFTYNTDGLLSSIGYLSKGDTAIYTVSYAYTNGMLTAVTDNDNEISSYCYETKEKPSEDGTVKKYVLTSASDIDGYKLEYTYNETEAAFQPYRVVSVEESCDDIKGGYLKFEYAHNQTTLTDHNGNVEILQFNNYGNTVSIQDDEGRAQYSQYAVNDASETGKTNQLRLASRLQNTVSNLCWATGFEGANSMTRKDSASTEGYALTENAAYYGNSGLELSGALTMGTGEVVIPKGEVMTFSAYVKTNGSQAKLTLGGEESQSLSGTGDWTRLEVSYTNNTEADQSIYAGVVTTGTGTAYVDCIQLEMNPTASRYNLIENGDFRAGNNGWYSGNDLVAESKLVDKEPATAQLGGKAYHAEGNPTGENRISQTVNISGEKGDTFVLTGWAKGDAVPTPKESNESKQRYYGIVAKFNYTETSKKSKTYVAKFNPDTDSTVNWQYSAEMMVAEYPYSSITVYIAYDRSANEAWFDGIQLFKEEFGQSYTYNENGDVIAVKDLQNDTTEYKYDDKGNVLKVIRDDKTLTTNTYDGYSNLTRSKNNITNVEYEYEYDDYGNNTEVSLINGTSAKITTAVAYTSDGNRVVSNTDSLGRVTRYNYDENTNVLLSTQYPEDTEQTATVYTYDEMYRMATVEATTDTGLELSAEYTYSNDRLTAIETASTTYGFAYNDFGLRTKVEAGERLLASYTYTDNRNFYLQSLDYGNGDKVSYQYDDKGRMIKQTYEDGDTVTYQYDNYGALASVTDGTTGRTTTYYYDFTDRLMKYEEKDIYGYRRTFSYTYDDKNNLSSTVDNHYGVDFTYNYTYDDSNRITKVSSVLASREYEYDNYGRTNELITTNGTSNVKTETFAFTSDGNTTSTQISGHTIVYGNTNAAYSYTYDDNGNILSISDGTNTISYEYDTANQLIKETNPAGGYVHTWTYDNAGNILERKEYSCVEGVQGELTATVTYGYNDAKNWGDLLTSYNGKEITYDNIGNPLTDGTWNYTWEHGRQLASMSNGTTTWNYTYNADGLRTSKTDGTTYYSYVYTGDQLTYMTAGDKHIYFSYDASGTPMTIIYAGTVYYYVTNVQGDVIGLLDASGNQVVSYSYDAWGNILSATGSLKDTLGAHNPLRYRSYVYDEETQLYYLQSRYYNPEVGRFINADNYPSTGQGLLGNNMFAYCGNNPISRLDVCGESFSFIFGHNFNIFGWGMVGSVNIVSTKENLGVQYSYYFSDDNESSLKPNQTIGVDIGPYFGIQYTEKDDMRDLEGYSRSTGGDLFFGGELLTDENGHYLGWQIGESAISANMHSYHTQTYTLFKIPTIKWAKPLVEWLLGDQ